MTLRVPASQQRGAARQAQKPEQDPDRQAIRGTELEGFVQGFVKCRTFFELFDGERLELESSFCARDAPAARRPMNIAESFDDRIRQRGRQFRALVTGDDERTSAIAGFVPKQ